MADRSSGTVVELRARVEGALLAAAVGDALGWPQETRAHRVGGRRGIEPRFDFVGWSRREGGRYMAHEEPVAAGEYSDDVQLMLAIARSLARGSRWWLHWTERELPFWLTYERGGGGATKRAAGLWARGHAPWAAAKREDQQRFFDAGGNGVAMRILPHCIAGISGNDFQPIAAAIMADGITTHGHPRALVGSLAYGFAVWRGLRQRAPLAYGELVEETMKSAEVWSQLPDVEHVAPEWEARRASLTAYERAWGKTVAEMIDLLGAARSGMGQGSLAVDRATLDDIGCFDQKVGGAGTVAAAGALFLASRYAAQPRQGLLAAAFAMRADTDTLASMTGGLLGAINGSDWLGSLVQRVQDAEYLRRIAGDLCDGGVHGGPNHEGRWSESASRRLVDGLEQVRDGDRLDLPIGTTAELVDRAELPARSEKLLVHRWVLRTADGQTLRFKKVSRNNAAPDRSEAPTRDDGPSRQPRVGVALRVADLAQTQRFYQDVLGLEVTKSSAQSMSFAGTLLIQPHADPASGLQQSPVDSTKGQLHLPEDDGVPQVASQTIMILLDAKEFDATRRRVEKAGVPVSVDARRDGPRRFRCVDPDGNVIELRELLNHRPSS